MFSSVIVPVEGTPSSLRTVPIAMTLARQIGAPVVVVRVVASDEEVAPATLQMRALLAPTTDGVSLEVLVGDSVGTELLGFVHRQDSPLVVMATYARTAVGELLLGSVADEIVRHAEVPVVMIGPNVEPLPDGERYEELIACVDDTTLRRRLAPVVANSTTDLAMVATMFEVDAPAEHSVHAVLDFASRRRAPILAVATRGRPPAERLLESSTAIALIRSATCPVLVIGPSVVWDPEP